MLGSIPLLEKNKGGSKGEEGRRREVGREGGKGRRGGRGEKGEEGREGRGEERVPFSALCLRKSKKTSFCTAGNEEPCQTLDPPAL